MVTIDGKLFPSVTEVLREVGLGPDFSMVPPATLEHARLRGRALHKAIEWHALGILDEASIHPEVAPGFSAYLKFLVETHHEPLYSEIELMHPQWQFIGHPDRIGWINGQTRVLIDFKYMDSLDLDPVGRQLAGYALLWDATHPTEPIHDYLAGQFRHDGTYRLHRIDPEPHKQVFLASLVVFQARRRP